MGNCDIATLDAILSFWASSVVKLRYLMPIYPMLALLTAYTIATWETKWKKSLVTITLVLSFFLNLYWVLLYTAKVNPISFRLQVHKNWDSRWFASKRDFAKWLIEDHRIRELIEKKFESRPTINKIEIERSANLITITIHTAKAGVVIGRGGAGVTELKAAIEKIASLPTRLNIEEVKRPELAAKLVAENIAKQLERRVNFRRAIKMTAQSVISAGAKGVRIQVAGRLNNAEMARREKVIEGSVPLHTLRADIDYYGARAQTPAGTIGVKVWIYKGERV